MKMAALTTVSFQNLFSVTTNHFLETLYEMGNANIRTGMDLPFELTEKARDEKNKIHTKMIKFFQSFHSNSKKIYCCVRKKIWTR